MEDRGWHDNVGIKGKIRIQLWDEGGNLKEDRIVFNTVTALGDAWVAGCCTDNSESYMTHMAVGAGTAGATSLGAELDRNALTSTTQGSGGDDNDVIYIGDWAAGDGTGPIIEAGVFNSVVGGTMAISSAFSVINKAALDSLKLTWTVTHGAT